MATIKEIIAQYFSARDQQDSLEAFVADQQFVVNKTNEMLSQQMEVLAERQESVAKNQAMLNVAEGQLKAWDEPIPEQTES